MSGKLVVSTRRSPVSMDGLPARTRLRIPLPMRFQTRFQKRFQNGFQKGFQNGFQG